MLSVVQPCHVALDLPKLDVNRLFASWFRCVVVVEYFSVFIFGVTGRADSHAKLIWAILHGSF